ncbi:MAG: hypothetical protein E6G68_04935 [Actinobacteria bacterium]|nr:MAG: hypothetical protein E6G68_04935 [Actinomycetota bacterium]
MERRAIVARAERRPEELAELPDFTIITGLSGAGRSEAAKALEDLGHFVVDNLPPALIGKMAELAQRPGSAVQHIALVVDVRGGEFFPELTEALKDLASSGVDYRILFLTADDDVLVRRFEATRRRRSNASTSPTPGRPRSWGRWWCSRMGSRSGPTTAGSRFAGSKARTTSRRWRRSSAAASSATSRTATCRRRKGAGSRTRRTSS